MEESVSQLIDETQEAQDEVPNFTLEHLRNKLEYFNVKANFFENQTSILNEIIHKVELKGMELSKEEQQLTDKLAEKAEVKKNLVNILKSMKIQQKVKTNKKNDETLTKINGFYNCPECPYKTKWTRNHIKLHINAVHRKLKPLKCSVCNKGKGIKTNHSKSFTK